MGRGGSNPRLIREAVGRGAGGRGDVAPLIRAASGKGRPALVRQTTPGPRQAPATGPASTFASQDGMPCGPRNNPGSMVFQGGKCVPAGAPVATSPGSGAAADLAAGMVAALAPAGSSPTSVPSTTQIWGGTWGGGGGGYPSATPTSNAASSDVLVNDALEASPVGDAPKKAAGGGLALGLAAAGFLLGGPLGAVAGLAAGSFLGKPKAPKTGTEAQAGLMAAQGASVRAQQIDQTEQSSQQSVAQLQGFMGY